MTIKEGDKIPSITLKHLTDEGMQDLTTDHLFINKKVIMFCIPAAYSSTCSEQHLPGFLAHIDEFKAKGIETIVCLAVNDPFVMKAWAKDKGVGDKVVMLPDGNGTLTKALGLEFDGSGLGLGLRSKRSALIIEDGTVKTLRIEENPAAHTVTSAQSILQIL